MKFTGLNVSFTIHVSRNTDLPYILAYKPTPQLHIRNETKILPLNISRYSTVIDVLSPSPQLTVQICTNILGADRDYLKDLKHRLLMP